VPQIDRKSKQVKEQWHGKFYLQSVCGKARYLNTENIEVCGRLTKVEVIKCNLFAFSSMCAEYMQKINIFNFPRYCSNVPKVRWLMSYRFYNTFHTLSNSAKLLKIG